MAQRDEIGAVVADTERDDFGGCMRVIIKDGIGRSSERVKLEGTG